MLNWNNLDTLAFIRSWKKAERINLAEVMSGENGAERKNLQHLDRGWSDF